MGGNLGFDGSIIFFHAVFVCLLKLHFTLEAPSLVVNHELSVVTVALQTMFALVFFHGRLALVCFSLVQFPFFVCTDFLLIASARVFATGKDKKHIASTQKKKGTSAILLYSSLHIFNGINFLGLSINLFLEFSSHGTLLLKYPELVSFCLLLSFL